LEKIDNFGVMRHIDWSNAYGVCQNVDKTFTDLTPIGEGTYGVVYKARWRNPPHDLVGTPWVALKKVRISDYDNRKERVKPLLEGLPITSVLFAFCFRS